MQTAGLFHAFLIGVAQSPDAGRPCAGLSGIIDDVSRPPDQSRLDVRIRRFSSSGVSFGPSILIVSLLSLPVNLNGSW
jgi:hypothetical protein